MSSDTFECTVEFAWDDEAAVWVATSRDVEGLVMEGGSFDGLVERVRYAIPELLELNRRTPQVIDLTFTSRRNDLVTLHG